MNHIQSAINQHYQNTEGGGQEAIEETEKIYTKFPDFSARRASIAHLKQQKAYAIQVGVPLNGVDGHPLIKLSETFWKTITTVSR